MRSEVVHPAVDARTLESSAVAKLVLGSTSMYEAPSEVAAWVGRLSAQESIRVLLAWDHRCPVGWLLLRLWDGYATAEPVPGATPGWPTVARGADTVAVGRSLLGTAEQVAADTCRTLLVCIEYGVDVEPKRLRWLRQQYEQIGYGFTDLVHYHVRLGMGTRIALPPLPQGVRIAPLCDANPADLADCVRSAFSGPASAFFFGASAEERERFLGSVLDPNAAHEPASSVLYVGDRLTGFLTCTGQEDGGNLLIDWMGIRPERQRRGLGTVLLRHALAVAAASRYVTASGSANSGNASSIRLLESLGWEVEGGERQFVKVLA